MTVMQLRPRRLTVADRSALRALIAVDPVVNASIDARLTAAPDLDARRLGGELWGVDEAGGRLRAAIYAGGNLIPLGTDTDALEVLAAQLSRSGRLCSSIVGPAESVAAMWPILSARWGRARSFRDNQPFLQAASWPEGVARDAQVRPVRRVELDRFLPAAISMFTEELGISPLAHDTQANYRSRVSDMITAGRALARFDETDTVVFKAEIGSVTASTAQIQGVWVRPDLRGTGLGTAGMASVLRFALTLAPSASLYVNDFNTAAVRMYARLGMRQTATLSTILF